MHAETQICRKPFHPGTQFEFLLVFDHPAIAACQFDDDCSCKCLVLLIATEN